MKNSKLKAQKKREHQQRMSLALEEKLLKNEQRIKQLTGGFALYGIQRNKEIINKEFTGHKETIVRRNYQGLLPAKADPKHVDKKKRIYTEEEMIREAKAQAEIHEKKKLAMPLYNKGGLQYPTQDEINAMKNGELRRRS